MHPLRPAATAAPCSTRQVGLYLSVLAELQWPYAIMENVTGLLAGRCAWGLCWVAEKATCMPACRASGVHGMAHSSASRQRKLGQSQCEKHLGLHLPPASRSWQHPAVHHLVFGGDGLSGKLGLTASLL